MCGFCPDRSGFYGPHMRWVNRRGPDLVRPPRRVDSGAAAVEFALVSSLLFLLVFAIIDYGLWFNDSLNLRQGVREGARVGVVQNFAQPTCTQADPMQKLACKTRIEIGAVTGTSYVMIATPDGGWKKGKPLVVCGMVKSDGVTGLVPLPNDRIIRSRTEMSIEVDTPTPSAEDYADTPPPGASWSWCCEAPRRVRSGGGCRRGSGRHAIRDRRAGGRPRARARQTAAGTELRRRRGPGRGGRLYASGTVDKAAAVAAAKEYAQNNYDIAPSEWSTCTDGARAASFPGFTPSTETDCISFRAAPGGQTEIRVVLPGREVETTFGKLVGVSSVPIGASAHALGQAGGQAPCGLCIIGPGANDFQNGGVTVTNTSVYVNGTFTTKNGALEVTNGTISLQDTDNDTGKGTVTPQPAFSQPAIADPLAWLPLPPDMTGLQAKTSSACTSGQGVYKSLNIPNNQTCTLQPGLYIVTAANHISGNKSTKVIANGVTLFFTCQDYPRPNRRCAPATATRRAGTCSSRARGPSPSTLPPQAPPRGSRSCPIATTPRPSVSGATVPTGPRGRFDAKNGTFQYNGNGAGAGLNSLVVVKDLDFNGNPSAYDLTYTEDKNVKMPPGDLHLSY